jgi:hypothetical protein
MLNSDNLVKKEKIEAVLRRGECEVTFRKTNGEEREMICTLHPDYLPAPAVDSSAGAGTKKPPNENVVAVWDIDAEGWRSFRIDSIISGPRLVK